MMNDPGVLGVYAVALACGILPFVVVCRLIMALRIRLAVFIVGGLALLLVAASASSISILFIDPLLSIVVVLFALGPATFGALCGLVVGGIVMWRRGRSS